MYDFLAWDLFLIKAQVREINVMFVSGANSNNKEAYSRHKFGQMDIALIIMVIQN